MQVEDAALYQTAQVAMNVGRAQVHFPIVRARRIVRGGWLGSNDGDVSHLEIDFHDLR